MKLVGAGLALFSVTEASLRLMRQKFQEMSDRNLAAGPPVDNVNKYGCWCYFDNDVGNGKGVPMDLIDEECRSLHRGYECIVADDPSCTPWTVTYIPLLGGNAGLITQMGSVAAACDHANTVIAPLGTCAANACKVETQFLIDYTLVTQNYNPQFATYSHAGAGQGGNFNPKRNCVTNTQGTSDKGARDCCGAYPFRFPYKTFGNTHACCDDAGKSYNTATQTCCKSGGVIVPLGSPCPP